MSSAAKRWRCPYCHVTKTSVLKPPSTPCSGRILANGKRGFHKWERIG